MSSIESMTGTAFPLVNFASDPDQSTSVHSAAQSTRIYVSRKCLFSETEPGRTYGVRFISTASAVAECPSRRKQTRREFTVISRDNAGNMETKSVTYKVEQRQCVTGGVSRDLRARHRPGYIDNSSRSLVRNVRGCSGVTNLGDFPRGKTSAKRRPFRYAEGLELADCA